MRKVWGSNPVSGTAYIQSHQPTQLSILSESVNEYQGCLFWNIQSRATLTKIFKAGPWPAKAKFYFSLPRQPWLLLVLLAKAALAKGHPWQLY